MIPLACAAAWPVAQLVLRTAASPAEAQLAALNWLTFLLVWAIAFDLGADSSTRHDMLRFLTIAGCVVAVLAVLQERTSAGKIFWIFPSGYADGVFGPFVNRNQFAAWIELLLPPALYLAFGRGQPRWPYFGAAAVFYGSVVAAASRAGFLLATVEVAVVLGLLAACRHLPGKALLQFGGLAVAALLVVGWQGLRIRFAERGNESVRLDTLRASIHMVRDRPLTGYGLGSWSQIYPRYAGFDTGVFVNQAHNDWAQWAAEGGIPFFAFLLIFAALCCRPAVRSIYGLGVLAFLMHALVDYPMQQRPGLAAWFFAMAGLALSAHGSGDH